MMNGLMLRIGLKKWYNLKRVYELVGLMMLYLMIIDEWLGCEGVVFVAVVLLKYLVLVTFAWFLGNY